MKSPKIYIQFLVIALVFAGLTFVSCEKEIRKFDVSGKVYDPKLNKSVSGAQVVLRGSKIKSGIYNSNYVDIESTTTSSDGSYSFKVPEETVSGYRFYINKENYFDQLIDIETEELQKNEGFNLNTNLLPISYIALSVKNTTPIGSDDEIRFRFKDVEVQCKDCWNKTTITGTGPFYSYVRTAQTSGETDLVLEWIVTKGGQQHIYSDTLKTKAFQTISYAINY